ncbi:methyltransferase domain-containing protein [Methanosphaera sp. ISO3-F5]|uniref:class I SAM-dependent methyltransferase n=1 Tax=Methanosphaera sp. ISO3-F5 TaxID=1452353 RepID=UPI002B2584B4|nr:methyltransferase domain-containing protein [Methanosphaera sp. ISO3-F5]WQH63560.1 methyltransferase domain-containing protein [Methanosphaera sp. ISO3-F5]
MNDPNDLLWDSKLNISTDVFDYLEEDYQNYGYDPTPYVVLEELVKLDLICEDDVVVDYGCGLGRVGFFLNKLLGCRVIGVDHSERLLNMAFKNLERYGDTGDVVFVHSKAEKYVPDEANCFYLFNPFSSKIFRQVLRRIEESVDVNPRDVLIFFYYSTVEYKLYLPTETRLELVKSVNFSEEKINDRVSAKLDVFKLKK